MPHRSSSSSNEPSGRLHRGSLVTIFLTVFIDLLGFGLVLPLLPLYAEQYAIDASGWRLGLLMASFSAMQFLFAPWWGRLSDRIGRRPVIIIGLAGSVIFYTLFGIATVWKSLAWLFVSRIGAGIMGATISTAQAYIADTTSKEERPRGMALIGMAFGLGFTLGPLLGLVAVPDGHGDPGPGPGFVAAGLSAMALCLAIVWLPESLDRSRGGKSDSSRHGMWRIGDVLQIPSIGLLLASLFISVFSFANFETTLSLLMKGTEGLASFAFSHRQICLTYAYVGLVLAVVQGGIVRRLAGRASEAKMAIGGALAQVVGFVSIRQAAVAGSTSGLYAALAVIVAGFAFLTPSINSLLSRRSDPARQGAVLGWGQSVNSLARIIGSAIGIPLLRYDMSAPYWTAAGLMLVGGLCIAVAARSGRDFSHEDLESGGAA